MKALKIPKPFLHPATHKWGCYFEEIVDGEVKRRRKYAIYSTKEEAQVRCTRIYNKQNPKTRKAVTKLNNAQQDEALWAFEELSKFDVKKNSLRSAVNYYIANYRESGETRETAIVVDEWLKKKKQELQPSSYAPLKSRFEKFKLRFDHKIGEIESNDLINFIQCYTKFEKLKGNKSREGKLRSEGMQKKLFTHLREFYDHACNPSNPLKEMNYNPWGEVAFYFRNAFGDDDHTPSTLHLGEIEKALKLAKKFKSSRGQQGEFLGILVLGMLCGLRPSEVRNLSLQEDIFGEFIQLKKQQLRITQDICTKLRDVRTVDLKENVIEWLMYLKDNKLPVHPSPYVFQKYNGVFRAEILGERSKDKNWNDVYRHTFVTFLYNAALEDKEKFSFDYITSQVGHSMQVQEKHYRGVLHDDEHAPDFWKLTPNSVEKV